MLKGLGFRAQGLVELMGLRESLQVVAVLGSRVMGLPWLVSLEPRLCAMYRAFGGTGFGVRHPHLQTLRINDSGPKQGSILCLSSASPISSA